jgi:hypothetical protein
MRIFPISRRQLMAKVTVLISANIVALILTSTFPTRASAADRASVARSIDLDQLRLQAPIGHRQPRTQDLPGIAQPQEEDSVSPDQRRLDRLLSICRGC